MSLLLPMLFATVNASSGYVETPEWQKQLFRLNKGEAAIVSVEGDNRFTWGTHMDSPVNVLIARVDLRDIHVLNPTKNPYPLEYWLTPGKRRLTVVCDAWRSNRHVTATGELLVTLELGKQYQLKAMNTPANPEDWDQPGVCSPTLVTVGEEATKLPAAITTHTP